MLVFSGFVPHTPLLIPNIGKENIKKLKKTINALEALNGKLEESRPETLVIISGHHSFLSDHFVMNMHPEFKGDFQEFSDLSTELVYKADITTINEIRDYVEDRVPLALKSEENLEYGIISPLFHLMKKLPQVKIIPISYSTLPKETHFKFGELLKEVLAHSHKRIALIAAGDLSHKLSRKMPGGYSKRGKEYDELMRKILETKDLEKFLSIPEDLITEAGECSYYSLLIFMGIMHKIKYNPETLAYEHPFGVGYLTINFKF